jgi:hypothetical protein
MWGVASHTPRVMRHSVTTSRDLLREFRTLCSYIQVDPGDPSGMARALNFLRRFRPLSEDKLTL